MKSFVHVCLVAAVMLPAAAASGDLDPVIPLEGFGHFAARGRTHAEVEKLLRPPDYRLTPDFWVYWNCEPTHPDDIAQGFDTMIVGFANGRVNSVRLAPKAWVKALIARLEAKRRDPGASGSSAAVAQR